MGRVVASRRVLHAYYLPLVLKRDTSTPPPPGSPRPQAEDDFEDHAERVNDKLTVMAEAAEAREARLKADNNILKRTNLRLKGGGRAGAQRWRAGGGAERSCRRRGSAGRWQTVGLAENVERFLFYLRFY